MEFIIQTFFYSPLGNVFLFIIICALIGYVQSFIDLIERFFFPKQHIENIKQEIMIDMKKNEKK